MANAEHLALLQRGIAAWNEWREHTNNCEILIDLMGANLSGLNLSQANLSRANLSGTDLSGVNLSNVNLTMANLSEANLNDADLTGSDLRMANLRMANLSGANLSEADLTGAYLTLANLNQANLSHANCSGVNCRMAYLGDTNLRGTNFSEANLSGTLLVNSEALNTNFKKAIFTGACLQDWIIDSTTTLDYVMCDYVYLKPNQQERRPISGNFATGEFPRLFGRAANPAEMMVCVEANAVEAYQINSDSPSSTLQPETVPVRVPDTVNTLQVNPIDSNLQKTTLQAETVVRVPDAVDTVPVDPIGKTIPSSTSQQDLVNVAAEIQQLLELGQIYPATTPIEKLIVVLDVVRQIERNPTLKVRIVNALSETDSETLKALIDNPLTNIFFAAVEDWNF
ncbi:MAG: pentapeptide repeat-containing protein [Cyanobacteriota bacterium]